MIWRVIWADVWWLPWRNTRRWVAAQSILASHQRPTLASACTLLVAASAKQYIFAFYTYSYVDEFRLVPRSQNDPRSWVRWVQGLGPWWTLDLARPFCRGTLETQDLKIVMCCKTLETQDLNISICSETLETQDLKIVIVTKPWKPRTLKLGYVAKPWKPRTQNLKILMSRDFKVLGPYTVQYRISCWALCQGVNSNRWWTRTIGVQKHKL